VPQAELTGARLSDSIADVLSDPARLRAMSAKSRAMRRIDAGEKIVRECYALAGRAEDGDGAV
ncbi:MAG: hypothetical protein NNA21_11445, partial [Nitrospira sp.]|nr:hypothetical protein [Nitrospira sp.]